MTIVITWASVWAVAKWALVFFFGMATGIVALCAWLNRASR